jgi:hypothetical protein
MNKEDIYKMVRESDLGFLLGDNWMMHHEFEYFADLVASAERERIYAEQLELPQPRLTGKFSITAGKFKCTGCTGTWTNREDAKHHSCKDYQ